jgi:hypothetical protein
LAQAEAESLSAIIPHPREESGLRQIIPVFLTTLAVCVGYVSAGPMAGMFIAKEDTPLPVVVFEDAKTDFISVAVFEGDKVRGYLSFRVAFSISNAERAPEVGYLASNAVMRKKLSIADIEGQLPAFSRKLESEIKTHVEGKLPAELVNSVRIADFGFDARI